MFEIIVAIIVLVCIIYLFKGNFIRGEVGITVLESLPLSIFKKINSDESSYSYEKQKSTSLQVDEKSNYNSIDVAVKSDKQDNLDTINDNIKEEKEEVVYWTPKGKTYHVKKTCRTLARSKVIHAGTIHESKKDFKCENCK